MSARVANCPSCGAEITFRWSGAVQTTCAFCSSILVRHDVDLRKVGTVSEPPPVTSPIQIGTEGRHEGRAFTVLGRIAYAWQRGEWSEWHIVFEDGASGWLSDAQSDYAITFQVPEASHLPDAGDVRPGTPVVHEGVGFEVTSVTHARYAGVEGELPFEYWDHEEVPFADLRTPDGRLATIDYSEAPPLLFVGEYVDVDGLRLSGLREKEEKRADAVRTLNCPSCAGAVTLLQAEQAVTAVCGSCGSVLDATTPGLDVVQAVGRFRRIEPDIPIGSVGRIRGHDYQVLGFQVRTIRVEGVPYSWQEYLLFNPERGHRYLSEYGGHWNDIVALKSVPKRRPGSHPAVELHGERFKHFQHAVAETTYVLGEFPWEIRVGDRATTDDYVCPPRMLSSESTEDERTWSLGEYTDPARLWEAFGLKGRPPRREGVFANQPSPVPGLGSTVSTFAVLTSILVALFLARIALPHSHGILSEEHVFDAARPDSAVVVLGPFTLEGRPSNLEVGLETTLNNAWGYFTISLLDVQSGESFDFGREVSYYRGVDGGERWTEGSWKERARIPSVPASEYMLRLVPEGPTSFQYRVRVRRDVPQGWHFLLALVLIAIPGAWAGLRHGTHEAQRWAESDYGSEG